MIAKEVFLKTIQSIPDGATLEHLDRSGNLSVVSDGEYIGYVDTRAGDFVNLADEALEAAEAHSMLDRHDVPRERADGVMTLVERIHCYHGGCN